jgi:large subunit ribosomal protein L4
VGSVELPEKIFEAEPSSAALYYSVKAYLTNQRQGNASTKTRAEVDLTKRKMYRQKGTGRARAGKASSPIRVGGGVAHGPRPHTFRQRVPKKVRRSAIRSAFSLKAAEGEVKVLENFTLDAPQTRTMAGMIRGLQVDDRKALLLMEASEPVVTKSCRNLPRLSVLPVAQVSAYDVVKADTVILTQGALARLESLWGGA